MDLPPQAVQQFSVQLLLWNPEDFPDNPEQVSPGIDVTIYGDGTYRATEFGSADGITLTSELYTTSDGRRFLRFPFTIDGV